MFRARKGNVFAGRSAGRSLPTGVFSDVTAPGFGHARTMERGVFEKAVKSANNVLRAAKPTKPDTADDRRK